jgi:hypothetical protein
MLWSLGLPVVSNAAEAFGCRIDLTSKGFELFVGMSNSFCACPERTSQFSTKVGDL